MVLHDLIAIYSHHFYVLIEREWVRPVQSDRGQAKGKKQVVFLRQIPSMIIEQILSLAKQAFSEKRH